MLFEFRYYENKRHGRPNFPFQIYKVMHTKLTQQILPIHWHDEMEIIFMDQGQAVFRIEEKEFHMKSGEALIVHPGELHSGYNVHSTEVTYYAIVFKLSWVFAYYQLNNDLHNENELSAFIREEVKLPAYLTTKEEAHIRLLLLIKQILHKYEHQHVGYELGLKGWLLILFSDIYELGLLEKGAGHRNKQHSEARALIRKVLRYMEEHSHEEIGLDQLADVISLSRSHFCRFFKAHTGMRPIEYLNFIRVHNAANMLRQGSCTVLEAAVESGFHHPSYFTKSFKRIFKMTPSEYKAQYSVELN